MQKPQGEKEQDNHKELKGSGAEGEAGEGSHGEHQTIQLQGIMWAWVMHTPAVTRVHLKKKDVLGCIKP